MLAHFFAKRMLNYRWWGGVLAGAALIAPQVAFAQGNILPTFRNSSDRFVELRTGVQRGIRSGSAARYYLYLRDPQVTSQRFIITELNQHFFQEGGRLSMEDMEVRLCSDLGNALKRAKCEGKAEIAEISLCSEVHGCQTYTPATGETVIDSEDYEGLSYISIEPVEPIEPGQDMNIVFSNVRNPRLAVDYQFNLSIATPQNRCAEDWRTSLGHCAIGTWIVPIKSSRND